MALVYKRSDSKTTRAYERSRGMEPNPGVNALTVVSNGRKGRVRENPFQWIEGRGQRHRHVSPKYKTLDGASGWKKRHSQSSARLYPVDERGTVVSRPISGKLLSNGGSEMAYNIGALRRAMRSNPRGRRVSVREQETAGGVKVSSRKRRTTRNKRRSTKRRKPTANRRRRTRKNSRRTSRRTRKNSRRRSRAPRRNSRRRRTRKNSRRRSRRSRAPRRNSRRRRTRKNSRRTSRRSSRRSRRPRRNTKRGGKKRTSRRTAYWQGRRVSKKRDREYLDKYLSKGYMPTTAPRYRTGKSRSGIPPVLVYPISKGQGRLQKRKSRRTSKSRSPKRRSVRARSLGASYRGGRKRRMAANRRRSRRTSRRRSRRTSVRANRRRTRRNTRRRSRRRASVRPNRRRSRRGSRRKSRRRRSRRVRPNLLSTSKVRWGRSGKTRTGRPVGGTYQVLAYGPGSRTRGGKKIKGYPVYIPGHVISTAAVRKYRGLGGAAKDSHRRATRRGYRERKKYPRRRVTRNTRRNSMRRNRRRSRRRSTRRNRSRRSSIRRNSRRRSRRNSRRRSRRNPKYVVANRRRRSRRRSRAPKANRRRRRVRRNQGFFGADLMGDVLVPIAGATGGFIGARVLSNGIANVQGIRNILDKDKPAGEAENTKIAANVLGIVATLGLSTKFPMVRRHRGALIAGMGLALTDRLLGKVSGDASAYLSGFGEYVSQPLGEYVSQPLGAYTGSMGEYVEQPLGNTLYAAAGLGAGPAMQAAAGYAEGVDPGDQGSVDGAMDVMEAAAGTGAMYATAGMGAMYATAGLGAEADAGLKQMYARSQPPFASIQTPTDVARPVSATMPYARQVPDTLVTPEGKGYAGGLFARNLFGGMF